MRLNKSYLIILLGTIIQFFFLLANETLMSPFLLVGTVLLVLTTIGFSEKYNLLLFVFLVPNQRLITLIGSNISLLNFILIYLLVKMVLFRSLKLYRRQLGLCSILILYSLLVLGMFLVLDSVFIMDSMFYISVVIKFSLMCIVILSCIGDPEINVEFEPMAAMFVFGCIASNLLNVIFFGADMSIRFGGNGISSPNFTGSVLSFSLSCVILFFLSGKWSLRSVFLSITTLIMFGLLTQSRSFLLCLVLIMAVASFYLLGKKGGRVLLCQLFIVLLIFILGVALFESSYFAEVLNNTLSRVTNPRRGDISGGRLFLWKSYYNYLVSNFNVMLFGAGPKNDMAQIGVSQVAHNAFLETIVNRGLVGLTIIVITYSLFVKKIYSFMYIRGFGSYKLIGALPLMVLLTTSMTGHGILSIGFITQLFIGALALNINLNGNPCFRARI